MAILKDDTSYTHVIAIDFGTGASGYGIAPQLIETGQKPRIEVFNPCDDLDDQKTSTAILFDDEGNFLAFGTHALQRYAEILDDEETALLFQSYKMHLLHMDDNAISLDGRELPLMKVISESLRYISEKAMEKLTEQIGKVINSKIRWVLTVPALWGEEHKHFMRKAAMNANIIDTLSSPNLLLSLEPEGASIQCREDSEENIRNSLGKNKIVMVLDCGGGTVDITVHKLMWEPTESFLCEEYLPSSGGCEWGSKYVDVHFEKFLEEFFGEDLYSLYLKNALGRLEILKHFEMLKRKFNPGKDERSRLQLSYLGEDLSSGQLKELIDDWNSRNSSTDASKGNPYAGVQLKKRGASGVDLPPQLMKSFFEPLFEQIVEKVQQLTEDAINTKGAAIDFIFMVGGFSESPYLKSVIKDHFEKEDLHVLVPRRPQVSVIRGACMFGLNPRSITSRISKKTYGINTLTTFDPEKHPEEKKVIIEGEEFWEDVFDAFVKKNQSVGIDEVHVKTYCPVRARQTVMRIIFYWTNEEEVLFIDDDHVEQLGELSIDIGRPFQSVEDKTVKVTLVFGATNINATATNFEGTELRNCEFKFESS